ncbi:MAG TPA: DoxX family protein [Candidatus Paceibacterota bacterium]
MKSFFNGASRFWFARSLGILIIRLEVGFVFLTHGLSKVENISRTTQMFVGMGFPAWVGFFIGWLEVIGGAALILGILTRVFAVAFGIEMLVAVALSLARAGSSMAAAAPSWQSTIGGMEMFLAIMSFAIALMGSGRYALYAMECRNCGGMKCDGLECPGPRNP